jgi:hypothetical protein
MLVEVYANGQSVQQRRLHDDDPGGGRGRHGHRGGIGERYEQSSPEIRHAGESLFPARPIGSGSQPYLEGIGVGPRRTRRQRGGDVFYLRGIAADLHARGSSDGGPLNHCTEHFGTIREPAHRLEN